MVVYHFDVFFRPPEDENDKLDTEGLHGCNRWNASTF